MDEVIWGVTLDDSARGQIFRNTVGAGTPIEPGYVMANVADEEMDGMAPVRETMYCGSEALFERPVGPLNLGDMFTSRTDVQDGGEQCIFKTFEAIVCMNVGDVEPSGSVDVHHLS